MVVGFGPEMKTVFGTNELRRDAHLIAGPSHRALDDMGNAERRGNLGYRNILALEVKGGGSGRDQQLWHSRQRIENLFGQPIGKKLVVRPAAHRDKRQHGHGQVCADSFRRRFAAQQELVGEQERNGGNQDDGYGSIELASRLAGDGFLPVHFVLALYALWRQLEGPGKEDGEREADDKKQHQDLHDPGGRRCVAEHDIGDLHDQPG